MPEAGMKSFARCLLLKEGFQLLAEIQHLNENSYMTLKRNHGTFIPQRPCVALVM